MPLTRNFQAIPKRNKPVDLEKLAFKRAEMARVRAEIRTIRRKLKLQIVEKLGGKCVGCGYCRCLQCLTFHHLDPAIKEGQISKMLSDAAYHIYRKQHDKVQPLIGEIKKCELLCPTCHTERHVMDDD